MPLRAPALLLAAVSAASPVPAQRAAPARAQAAPACSITYASEGDLRDVLVERGFGFRGYDALCERLRREGLMVDFTHSSGVLAERSYAWVTGRLMRRSTGVVAVKGRSDTILSRTASTPEARAMLHDAANGVLQAIAADADAHVASVVAEEARLRAALAAPARGS